MEPGESRPRTVDEMSLEELEGIVAERRRIERARRFAAEQMSGRFRPITVAPGGAAKPKSRRQLGARDRILLGVELVAIAAMLVVLGAAILNWSVMRGEAAQAVSSQPAQGPQGNLETLPGSSFAPAGSTGSELPGSSVPPLGLPPALGLNLQPVPGLPPPTSGPNSPTRIVIRTIHVDWPIVEGDGWEELKAGVGHHPGSANPGERGNLVLSGHNDVFGEVFKDLGNLNEGEGLEIYVGGRVFHYTVRAKRVVNPTDLSVLTPSRDPIATLITCTPYLVDTMRLAVVAELTP